MKKADQYLSRFSSAAGGELNAKIPAGQRSHSRQGSLQIPHTTSVFRATLYNGYIVDGSRKGPQDNFTRERAGNHESNCLTKKARQKKTGHEKARISFAVHRYRSSQWKALDVCVYTAGRGG